MRKTLLFILMAFCTIASSFAQTPKDVLAFQFKTSIASSAMLYFEVNSPQEEFYVDWGDGFKKKYAAGNYAYPNPVYSTNHKEEVKIYGTGINAIKIASLPEASADNKGYVIYWDKETFPDDEEGNIYDIALSNKADLKHWVISNGENTPLGIDELTINGDSKTFLSIASDKVLINGEYTDAQIFSTSGQTVARLYGEKEFNVAQLAEGVYIIKVNANGKKTVAKFVVKR